MRAPSAYAQRVLDVVALIPPGRVMTYGDVRAYLEEGTARTVGAVLRSWGGGVPWHRVVMRDGSPAPHHRAEQLARLADDGTPLTGDGRVDLARAKWDGQ